jgi:hypothetical protein
MSISRIGSATGVASCTIPTHAVGDLILIFAFRDGNATAPLLPAGYTSVGTKSGTTCSARLGYKIATATNDGSGTWTNATEVVAVIYRPTPGNTIGIGASASNTGATNAANFAALTLNDTSGASWVAAGIGHRSLDQNIETAPTGMTNFADVLDATAEAAGHDTNGGVISWPSTNETLSGTASNWVSFVVEIQDIPPTVFTPATALSTADSNDGTLRMICKLAAGSQGKLAVTFRSIGATKVNNASIGKWTGSSSWPNTTTTPIELKFGGVSGLTLSDTGSVTSDFVDHSGSFSLAVGDYVVVTFDMDPTTSGQINSGGSANCDTWFGGSNPSYNLSDVSGLSGVSGWYEGGLNYQPTEPAGGWAFMVDHIYTAAGSSSSVNATGSITLGALTTSATAVAKVAASAAVTLSALTVSATAVAKDAASAAITLGALTAAVSASTGADNAEAAIALGALTVSARAVATDAASASITLGALTVAATATVESSASATITLGALTSAAVITNPEAAAAANTLGALTVAASATVTNNASASITLGALTTVARVSDTPGAVAAITLGALTVSATATVADAASASITLGALTVSATAEVEVSASAGIMLGSLIAAAAGAAPEAASAAGTLGELTTSSIVVNPVTAQANVMLGALTVSATARHAPRRVNPAALLI